MKRNGMCPLCFLKRLFTLPEKVTKVYNDEPYGNGVALTPPMGWSSWNTFKNRINQDVIYETAVAMKEKGLLDAGYGYINIDDNWVSSFRDENGRLTGDMITFKDGIENLVEKISALGIKTGIYSSNGTATCEDLPASQYYEWTDAYTFAKWGIEYFKYDFCHNVPYSKYAPLVWSVTVKNVRSDKETTYMCSEAKLSGNARLMNNGKLPDGKVVTGLDRIEGAMLFDNVTADEDGEYALAVNILKKGGYKKCVMVEINGKERYVIEIPPQKFYNYTARFSVVAKLNKGVNTIKLFNPVATRADSAMLQYLNMSKILKKATERVAAESGKPEKPIVFSICEWGRNQPYLWGASAGNLWRTTPDIRPHWPWMMVLYRHNVKLYEYAAPGGWNDPDMLEVGNGKLTKDENISHFSLWCMMCAPLILGNDLRNMSDEVLNIVTNKNLIAINQDKLGKQAKRIISGAVDVLIKPLFNGGAAVCVFNKSNKSKTYKLKMSKIYNDGYVDLTEGKKYTAYDQWNGGETGITDTLKVSLNPHGSAVFVIK